MGSCTNHVDHVWAKAFGLEPSAIHDEPVRVVAPAPWLEAYRGVWVLTLGPTTLISTPADHIGLGEAIAGGRDARDVARDVGGTFVGPSQHAYVHRDDHVPPQAPTTRRVTVEELEPLRRAVPADEWSEGGFGHGTEVVWASFEAGELVAADNLTDFDGAPADIGLVTHPDHRGRGHAQRLTADMTTWAISQAGVDVVRYRALTSNAASLAVARHAGFAPYGENVAIRLPDRVANGA